MKTVPQNIPYCRGRVTDTVFGKSEWPFKKGLLKYYCYYTAHYCYHTAYSCYYSIELPNQINFKHAHNM